MAADPPLKPRVFVTGANGFIGSNLCRCLLQEGYEVSGLVRPSSDLHFLEGLPVKLVYGDLCDPRSFDLLGELDGIIHAASIVSDEASEAECEAGIYGLTVNLIRKIAANGIRPRRIVYISSTLTLGYLGTNLSEENPGQPADFIPYVKAKKKTEAFLLDMAKTASLPVVILRPGDTYGPNDRTTCGKILRSAERGVPIVVGHGRHRFAYCYIGNLCQAVLLALKNDRAVGRAYTVTNGVCPSWREFLSGLQQGIGRRQRLYVPVWFAYLAAASQGFWKKICPSFRQELTRYRIQRITTETTYDISKTIAELGYCPNNDTEKQIQAIVDWYLDEREKGYIK